MGGSVLVEKEEGVHGNAYDVAIKGGSPLRLNPSLNPPMFMACDMIVSSPNSRINKEIAG